MPLTLRAMADRRVNRGGPVRFRNLLAGDEDVTVAVLDELELSQHAGEDRPHIAVNMIATLDGRATIDGRTAMLGGEADRALFHRLRAQGDAVMVGAATIRAERYGPLIRDSELRELRARRGLGDPLAVIVSASLRIDPSIPLLADPNSKIVVLTSSPDELEGSAASIEYLRGTGGDEMRLTPLLERLRREHGVRSIVCEGGPTLNDSLLVEDLIDELFITLTPTLVGGPEPLTIVSGAALRQPAEFELVGLLESEGHLFSRYRRAAPSAQAE
jgi:5-amino-6-(5-phosphoribosylamino)uracil reductase